MTPDDINKMTPAQITDLWNDVAFWKGIQDQIKDLTTPDDGTLYAKGCQADL